VAFAANSTPRGRDLRESLPQFGVCLQDYTIQSSIDVEPIPGLSVILEPHCSYAFSCYLAYLANTAADLRIQIDSPDLAAGSWAVQALTYLDTNKITGEFVSWLQEGPNPAGSQFLASGSASPLWERITGTCSTGGYGGTLQLSAAQRVSTAAATTVAAYSWLEVTKIEEL
jgi:hypothetical protein